MSGRSAARRSVLAGLGGLALPWVARGQQALEKVALSVGRIPWSSFNSPVTQHMIAHKLFEARAAELGYDVTVDWRDYRTALPMVEALVGNSLDMGMWGSTPIIRAISANLPISVMAAGEGHLRFVLATRRGSPVRTIQDIRGKAVGALVGGDPYNALSQMLRYELGSANPRELGIRIVNTPTLAEAAQVPPGMDAAIAIYPAFLAAEPGGTAGIMNSFGYTEEYYEGPLGKGAGLHLPSAAQSPFSRDGYWLHRSFWIVSNALADKAPRVVVAFLMAQQDAVAALSAMQPGPVSQLSRDYWMLGPEQGAKVVTDDLLYNRGWSWPTEGDAQAMLETSKYLVDAKVIPQPLTWAQVKEAFTRTAPLVRDAYGRLGSHPAETEFTRTDVGDLRGPPAWAMDRWTDRS